MFSVISVLPALLLFITVVYYPLVKTLFFSFTDWNGYSKSFNIVGMKNFTQIFKDYPVYISFWNTIYIAFVCLVVGTVVQFSLALILDMELKGSKIFKAVFYLPCVISPLIIAITWSQFFQYIGIINTLLNTLHLEMFTRDWLWNKDTVKNIICFINVWQWAGYGSIIYLTGLNSIPAEIYEACQLDGATGLKKLRYIILPLIMPAITINGFIGITGSLRIFDIPFALTQGGPMNASSTITMAIVNNAFDGQRFGYASSIGFLFFMFIAVLTVTQLRLTRRLEVEY